MDAGKESDEIKKVLEDCRVAIRREVRNFVSMLWNCPIDMRNVNESAAFVLDTSSKEKEITKGPVTGSMRNVEAPAI